MRKIYIIPNLVTTANILCGFYSIVLAVHSNFEHAAWAIMLAGVFDMLDGRIARLAKATSTFGVEYDSLSDVISFGMAPAILIYLWALEPFARAGWLAAFVFLACGALRLARFNTTVEVGPKGFFQGLPIPVAAGVVATFVIFSEGTGWPLGAARVPLAFSLVFSLAALMVSSVPFPSFKDLNWRSRGSAGYLLMGVGSMVLIVVRPEITLFLLASTYVVVGLIWYLSGRRRVVFPKTVISAEGGH